MKNFFVKFLNLFTLLACIAITGNAQKQLPELELITEQAENLLSWYCQFDGVKAISVQRSSDSVRNFTTIGMLNNPKKGNQFYRDLHPVVGKNYYRLSIEFGSDLEWFSNTYKCVIDSASFMKAILEKTKLAEQKAAELRLLEQATAAKKIQQHIILLLQLEFRILKKKSRCHQSLKFLRLCLPIKYLPIRLPGMYISNSKMPYRDIIIFVFMIP